MPERSLAPIVISEMRTHYNELIKKSYGICDAAYTAIVVGILEVVLDEVGRNPSMLEIEKRKETFDLLSKLARRVCIEGRALQKAIQDMFKEHLR